MVCGNQADAGTNTTHHSEAPMRDNLGRQVQHFEGSWKYPPQKRQRDFGLGLRIALLFVLLTGLFIGLLGVWLT